MPMRTFDLFYTRDWNQGTYTNCRADATVVSTYNHPALRPNLANVTNTANTATQVNAGATLSGTWNVRNSSGLASSTALGYLFSTLKGNTITWTTTTEVQLVIQFQGMEYFGDGWKMGSSNYGFDSLRNGAIASVSVDSIVVANVDTGNAAPLLTVNLDGKPHTVVITHTGYVNAQVLPNLLTPAVNTVNTTVAAGLSGCVVNGGQTTTASQWRVTVLTGLTTYRLDSSPPGTPSWSTVGTYTIGTSYSNSPINGITLKLTAGTYAIGDQATFSTDQSTVAVVSLVQWFGNGTTSGSYKTPIWDNGDQNTTWYLARWEKNAPYVGEVPPVITATIGNTVVAGVITDGVTYIAPAQTFVRSYDGVTIGVAGLQGAPDGRYCQLNITVPIASTGYSWLRDFRVFANVFTQTGDYDGIGLTNWPVNCTPNQLTVAMWGMVQVMSMKTEKKALQYLNAPNISASEDWYLVAHGNDRGLTMISGEDPFSYRARILAMNSGVLSGGSCAELCDQVAILVNDTVPTLTTTITSGKTSVSGGGVTVAQTGTFSLTVTIAHPSGSNYPGLLSLTLAQAQTAITSFVQTTLRPLGHSITLTFL